MPIIEQMKGLDCYAQSCVPSGTKKSHSKFHDLNGFVVPGGLRDIQLSPFLQYAAGGLLVELKRISLQSRPSAATFCIAHFSNGCRFLGFLRDRAIYSPAGSPPFQCHYVKEYSMSITNHIRKIQEHAESVIEHVDEKRYRMAHSALDIIATQVRESHEYIDKLQLVKPRDLAPAGGD